MAFLKKISISKTAFAAMFFIAAIAIWCMAGLWLSQDRIAAEHQIAEFRISHTRMKKAHVKTRVNDIIDLIQHHRESYRPGGWHVIVQAPETLPANASADKTASGVFDAAESLLQKEFIKQIASIRPKKDEYLFILDVEGNFLMHPIQPELVGKNIKAVTYTDGQAFFNQMTDAIQDSEGGYISYSWKKPSTGEVEKKLSYVHPIPQWRWVIGSGIYIDDIEADISKQTAERQAQLERQRMTIFLISITLLALMFLIARIISFLAHRSFTRFSDFFNEAARKNEPMPTRGLFFKEFDNLASHANQMVRERARLEAAMKKAEKEREELQEQLAGAKKMEALGLLAGGVAHDLNNILTGIVSYPEVLLETGDMDSDTRNGLETIQASGEKAAAVVKELITLARGVAAQLTPLSLNDEIENYLRSPEHISLLKTCPGTVVVKSLDPCTPTVSGSSIHIGKALMNLVYNSAEAVGHLERGMISITTESREVLKPPAGVLPGGFGVISIRDNGPGIPDQDLKRIFEPFYTKKFMGKSGTGLGLAIVWNVMQNHGGFVSVSSGPGGTSFDLFFPESDGDMLTPNITDVDISTLKGSGQSILVVDDEPLPRQIAVAMTGKLGYIPFAVDSGQAAVDFIRQKPVDILLLDMIMEPGMNGRETFEAVTAINPRQKAVIVSGFTHSEDVKATLAMGASAFIEKPYSFSSLGLTLLQVLDTRECP